MPKVHPGGHSSTMPAPQFLPTSYTEEEIWKMLSKSCELDPAPTWLLKRLAAEIASAQSQLIHMFLETGMVPKNFTQALVRPLLKGPNLNADDLKKTIDLSQTFHSCQSN